MRRIFVSLISKSLSKQITGNTVMQQRELKLGVKHDWNSFSVAPLC